MFCPPPQKKFPSYPHATCLAIIFITMDECGFRFGNLQQKGGKCKFKSPQYERSKCMKESGSISPDVNCSTMVPRSSNILDVRSDRHVAMQEGYSQVNPTTEDYSKIQHNTGHANNGTNLLPQEGYEDPPPDQVSGHGGYHCMGH